MVAVVDDNLLPCLLEKCISIREEDEHARDVVQRGERFSIFGNEIKNANRDDQVDQKEVCCRGVNIRDIDGYPGKRLETKKEYVSDT